MAQQIPMVSVAMLCCDDARHVTDAVNSVLQQQTCFSVEIVLADNCSNDSGQRILARLESTNPDRVRVIHSDRSVMPVVSFAVLLNQCRGKYIAIAECDGLWNDVSKLQKQIDYLEDHSSYVVCCHHLQRIDENGNSLSACQVDDGHSTLTFRELLRSDSIATGSIVMRRTESISQISFSIEPNGNEPWFWLLLNAARGEIGFINDSLAATRKSELKYGDSITFTDWYISRNRTLRRLRHHVKRSQRKHIDLQLSANHALISIEMARNIRDLAADRHRRLCFLYGRWQAPMPLRTRISYSIRPCRFLHAIAARTFELITAAKQWVLFVSFLIVTITRQPSWLLRIGRSLTSRGLAGFRREWRILEYLYGVSEQQYARWVRAFDTLTDADRNAIKRRIEAMQNRPVFSIIMPVYNTQESMLKQAIDSVVSQLYSNWELCIADDASSDPRVRMILKEYQDADHRIRCHFCEERGNISVASNTALRMATGEFVAMLDHDDELAEHALYMVAEEINQCSQADVIYSDEDRIDSHGRRVDPYFKTDWNPDLMLSQNMVCHLAVIRRQLVEDVGGFRAGFEGSQDHDLVLRCVEQTSSDRIRHVPAVLYHWRQTPGSVSVDSQTATAAHESGARAIQEHLIRQEVQASVEIETGRGARHYRVRYSMPKPPPLVSIIIPTKDRIDLLRRCVDGLLNGTDYPNLEIIIVDNESTETSAIDYLESLQQYAMVRVLKYAGDFNYSAMNNQATQCAQGTILCLLNNDIEIIHADWLSEMVSHAVRGDIGAVGAKLLYPDDSVQHAGVLIGYGGGAGHTFSGLPVETPVQQGRLEVLQNVSCVTAACMVLRKTVFEEMGGLDEKEFAVAYNDVDLCLRIVSSGYRIVWTPYAQLYHYESASRGKSRTLGEQDRDLREGNALRRRWSGRIATDPNLNPNISIDHVDYRPAFSPRTRRPWC